MFDNYLAAAADALRRLADSPEYPPFFETVADRLCAVFSGGGRVLLAGNGGSAADCQHLAGELVARFRFDRPGLPAIALTVDTSVLTAVLNDYGPEPVYARQVEALGRPGDLLWAFSTSGNSANILAACRAAKKLGMSVLGFTGEGGGELAGLSDLCFRAPSGVTSHIQECHIAAGHMLCGEIEVRMFRKK